MHTRAITRNFLAQALLLLAGPVFADVREIECRAATEECIAVGHWNLSMSLGAGVRSNPLIHSQDIPLLVIPQVSFYGKRFFIENLDVGFTLMDRAASTLAVVASPGYDRVFFYRSDLQNIFISPANAAVDSPNGQAVSTDAFFSRSRRFTYLAGPEWTFKFRGVVGQLDLLQEFTGASHGQEVRAAIGMDLWHSRADVRGSVGFTWKSAATVNYFYGAPDIYTPGPALNPFFKLAYERPLSGAWKLTALAHYERLGSAIANSPIVARHQVTTVFFGAKYGF